MNEFCGFTQLDGQFSIVTAQTWYQARNATWREISLYFRERGVPIRSDPYEDPTRWYQVGQNLAVFDVGESNVLNADGVLLPIDIIPLRPVGHLHQVLCDAAAHTRSRSSETSVSSAARAPVILRMKDVL